jgi:hypothetical protein
MKLIKGKVQITITPRRAALGTRDVGAQTVCVRAPNIDRMLYLAMILPISICTIQMFEINDNVEAVCMGSFGQPNLIAVRHTNLS